MKLIFLDIDGVLCIPIKGLQQGVLEEFDGNCVCEFKRVLEETDARIVISSVWRLDHIMPTLIKQFERHGLPVEKIIGKTPDMSTHKREIEILKWLEDYGEEVTHWCAVDDGALHLPGNFVRTEFNYDCGLTKEAADQMIAILNI